MKITLKLYASLAHYLPNRAERNQIRIEVDDGATIFDVLDRFNVPRTACHLVLVNGLFQPPSTRASTMLREGDELAVWPRIAGG